jgi:hypothetical protein
MRICFVPPGGSLPDRHKIQICLQLNFRIFLAQAVRAAAGPAYKQSWVVAAGQTASPLPSSAFSSLYLVRRDCP